MPVRSKAKARFLHYKPPQFQSKEVALEALRLKVLAELTGACWHSVMFKPPGLQRTETNQELRRRGSVESSLTSCVTWQGILWAASHTSLASQGRQDSAPAPCRTCAIGMVTVSGVPCCCPLGLCGCVPGLVPHFEGASHPTDQEQNTLLVTRLFHACPFPLWWVKYPLSWC